MAIFFSETKRQILVMHTLVMLVNCIIGFVYSGREGGRGGTHNPPSAKIPIRTIFCLMGKFSFDKAGTGIARITRSVAICIAAFEYQRPFWDRQCPGIVGSQNLATGMQLRNALRTHQVP